MIYLMGMPGCGKTTLGKKLSKALNLDFLDLDAYIEKKANMTIPEVFSRLGEKKFRELERDAVVDTTSFKNTVVACGGGAPCFYNNLEVMKTTGKTIYINVSAKELHRRLFSKGQSKRPLLKDKTEQDLLQEILEKKSSRDAFYLKASVIFYNDNLQLEHLMTSLKKVK